MTVLGIKCISCFEGARRCGMVTLGTGRECEMEVTLNIDENVTKIYTAKRR